MSFCYCLFAFPSLLLLFVVLLFVLLLEPAECNLHLIYANKWTKSRDERNAHRNDVGEGALSSNQDRAEFAMARLSTGLIKGRVSYAAGAHRPANVFLGVPFAEPPVGDLRWKELKRKKPWKGVLETTVTGSPCRSKPNEHSPPLPNSSDDCIYANVFADPACKRQKRPCPILVYIHGGAFRYNSESTNETPIVQNYASDGVIFVAAAYRFGVYGFLDLDDESVVKKNLGMYDILFALRWIKREAPAAFGGDPNRITIMGNSAGATAIVFLFASPLVRQNDFHRAILSSPEISENYCGNKRTSSAIGAHLNCSSSTSARETLNCLRRVPPQELDEAEAFAASLPGDEFECRLIYDGPVPDEKFVPGDGLSALSKLKHWKGRPFVVTTTKKEFGTSEYMTERRQCRMTASNFDLKSPEVFRACMLRYHDTRKVREPMRQNFEKYHAVAALLASVNRLKGSPSYVGSFELANHSMHADDLAFFGLGYREISLSTAAEKLMERFYPLFVRLFLATGHPEKDWEPADRFGRSFFVFDFVVNETNGTLSRRPHFVRDAYNDAPAVDFWLRQMPALERSSTGGSALIKPSSKREPSLQPTNNLLGLFLVKNDCSSLDSEGSTFESYCEQSLKRDEFFEERWMSDDYDQLAIIAWEALLFSIAISTIALVVVIVHDVFRRASRHRGYSRIDRDGPMAGSHG